MGKTPPPCVENGCHVNAAQASDRVASWDGAYRAHARAELLGRVRVGALLAAILVPAGAVLELVIDPGMVRTLLPARLVFGAVSLAIYGATRLPRAVRFAHPLSWLMGLQLATGVELVLLIGPGVASPYYAGLSVVIIALGLLFTWTTLEALAVNLAILAIYVVPALLLGEQASWRTLFSNVYFLANCSLLAVAASWIRGPAPAPRLLRPPRPRGAHPGARRRLGAALRLPRSAPGARPAQEPVLRPHQP